ncbi:uncharacterized protein LOC122399238 isoform X1 [Colletes gigas]|uniref:uncharacterized protein LOC122399238 isoform X1 n=1 Tax=Colletes gigas TaxID=935657 RepID=UPI001C9B0D2C|nr:uncharacterized protein LOC122399238 isoform X1 [Colletes gigas]XP_043255704.1 uncharacterized protein LOC122399238 isoform X1 [Colletes gigas]
MALKDCLLPTIAITISIGISSVLAWNSDIHRYESYDLDRGPVFYEAYYPDSNDELRGNYQEKRYFDRGAVLEKSYQIPSQRLAYSNNIVQLDNRQNLAGSVPRDARDDRFPPRANEQPLDIKEISSLARRAISRDLENWNTLESYLDRARYQDPIYRRQIVVPDPRYGIEQSDRGIGPDAFKDGRDFRRELYEEVREEPSDLSGRIRSSDDQRIPNAMRRLTARDTAGKNSLGTLESIRYQNQSPSKQEIVQVLGAKEANAPLMKDAENPKSIVDPYPSENIFAPRPQVINYIFSKKPIVSLENKDRVVSEAKETAKETMPRNYGDNIIREEMKKTQEDKDVKVASIEISEVPKHKTRHHHGEWPKRDYSRRHQS